MRVFTKKKQHQPQSAVLRVVTADKLLLAFWKIERQPIRFGQGADVKNEAQTGNDTNPSATQTPTPDPASTDNTSTNTTDVSVDEAKAAKKLEKAQKKEARQKEKIKE